jgi:hypothetical protein
MTSTTRRPRLKTKIDRAAKLELEIKAKQQVLKQLKAELSEHGVKFHDGLDTLYVPGKTHQAVISFTCPLKDDQKAELYPLLPGAVIRTESSAVTDEEALWKSLPLFHRKKYMDEVTVHRIKPDANLGDVKKLTTKPELIKTSANYDITRAAIHDVLKSADESKNSARLILDKAVKVKSVAFKELPKDEKSKSAAK